VITYDLLSGDDDAFALFYFLGVVDFEEDKLLVLCWWC
jgi:hypothetical protein